MPTCTAKGSQPCERAVMHRRDRHRSPTMARMTRVELGSGKRGARHPSIVRSVSGTLVPCGTHPLVRPPNTAELNADSDEESSRAQQGASIGPRSGRLRYGAAHGLWALPASPAPAAEPSSRESAATREPRPSSPRGRSPGRGRRRSTEGVGHEVEVRGETR